MTNSVENRGLQLIFEESKKNPLVYKVVKNFTYDIMYIYYSVNWRFHNLQQSAHQILTFLANVFAHSTDACHNRSISKFHKSANNDLRHAICRKKNWFFFQNI